MDCLSFFTFLRFGTSASITGFFVCHYVYILELVGPSYRTMGAKVMDFYWVTGASIMALLAYLIRDWRTLLLVASFPPALFLLLWMYVKQFCYFVTLYATHSEKEHREKNLMLTVDSFLTDTTIRRTSRSNGHLKLVPPFLYSQLSPRQTPLGPALSVSLRRPSVL